MAHAILGGATGRRRETRKLREYGRRSAPGSPICSLLAHYLTPIPLEPGAGDELSEALTAGYVDWRSVLKTASELLVAPALRDALIARGLWRSLPDEARDYLSSVHHLNTHRNQLLLKEISDLAALLNEVGIEPLLLKGIAHLVEGLHPSPGSRVMSDIDILVAEAKIPAARDRLERAGWWLMQPLPPDAPTNMVMHFVYAHDNAPARVELHQAFMAFEERNLLPASALLSVATPKKLPNGATVLLLPPQESLIVNIVHSQIRGDCHRLGLLGFRSLYDLVLLCHRYRDAIDWIALLDWFERRGWRTVLHARLLEAAAMFAVPVPLHLPQDAGVKLSLARIRLLRRFPVLRFFVHVSKQVPRTVRSLGWRAVGYYAKRATQYDFYYHMRRLMR